MTDHISSRESSPAASVKVFGELLARLEAATEWNRELDREVAWAVLEQDWSSDDWERAERRPQFTASLDAAIGLVERRGGHPQLMLLGAIASMEEGFDLKRLPLAVLSMLLRWEIDGAV